MGDLGEDAFYESAKEFRAEIFAGARGVEWQIVAKRGKVGSMGEGMIEELTRRWDRVKAQVWARVEDPFPVLKNLFRQRKTPYRGLAKNLAQRHRLFALANRFLARRALLHPARA